MISLQTRHSLHFYPGDQTASNPANQFIACHSPRQFRQSNIKQSLLGFVGLPQHRAAVAQAARLLLILLLQHFGGVVDAGVEVVVGALEEGGPAEVFGAFVGGGVGAEVLELVAEQGHQQEAEHSGQQARGDHVGEVVLVAVCLRDWYQPAGLQRRQRLEVEVDAHEHDLHGAEHQQEDEGCEFADVVGADAVVDPGAVVVVARDAPPADETVELGRLYVVPALGTEGQLHLQQVSGRLFGVLAGEQEVERHHQQVEEGGYSVEDEVGVLAKEVHLHQQVGGQEDEVEEHQEEHALLHRGPLHLVHDLHVAGDLHPLPVRKLVVEDPRHLALPQLPRQVDRPLLLQVGEVPVDSLQQHALHDLLVPSGDCQHQRRPPLVVPGVDVGVLAIEEVGGEVAEAVLCGLVEDGVACVVGLVDAEGDLALAVLEEVDCGLEVVVLRAHEEDALLLVGLDLHVGAVALEELDHFDVAVEGGEVEGGEAVGVLGVDPGLELALEGGAVLVALVEGLVVQDVDLHLGELVLEGGEVQQRGLVLLLHDGEVEFLPGLEVVAQVLVGLEAHDEADRLALAGLPLGAHQQNYNKARTHQVDSYSCSRTVQGQHEVRSSGAAPTAWTLGIYGCPGRAGRRSSSAAGWPVFTEGQRRVALRPFISSFGGREWFWVWAGD